MIKHRIETLSSTPLDVTYTGVVDPFIVVSIQNIMTTGYAYLGNENVTTSSYGHKLYPGQSFTAEISPNDKIYAVGDAGVQIAIFVLDVG